MYEEFPNKDFFIILGNHIGNLTAFTNPHTFLLLLNIFLKLNDNQKIDFVREILWNIKASRIENEETVKSYYLLLIKIYQNNKSVALATKNLTEILYWIVQVF